MKYIGSALILFFVLLSLHANALPPEVEALLNEQKAKGAVHIFKCQRDSEGGPIRLVSCTFYADETTTGMSGGTKHTGTKIDFGGGVCNMAFDIYELTFLRHSQSGGVNIQVVSNIDFLQRQNDAEQRRRDAEQRAREAEHRAREAEQRRRDAEQRRVDAARGAQRISTTQARARLEDFAARLTQANQEATNDLSSRLVAEGAKVRQLQVGAVKNADELYRITTTHGEFIVYETGGFHVLNYVSPRNEPPALLGGNNPDFCDKSEFVAYLQKYDIRVLEDDDTK